MAAALLPAPDNDSAAYTINALDDSQIGQLKFDLTEQVNARRKGARCLLRRASAFLLFQPFTPTTSSPHARPTPQVTSLALMPNACYIIAG